MRIVALAGISTVAALVAMIGSAGCYALGSDCELNYDCTGGSGGAGGATTTNTGGAGGAPPSCVPSNNSTPVGNDCGVFVSASKGEDTNDGTKEKPFATITMALSAAGNGPVYLCGETLLESVDLSANAVLYGGLDCAAEWKYDASKPSVLNASGDMIPVRVSSKTSAELYDVVVRADDALVAGGSSIGIIAEGESEVKLTRCRVEAGNGKNGKDSDPFLETAADGNPGLDGGMACSAGQVVTPEPIATRCGDVDSAGGGGGVGQSGSGLPGGPGLPESAMNGGLGEGAAVCTAGGAGDAGALGAPGDGATGLGSLQAGAGFSGLGGADGKPGAPGQGGGGGGGAKGGPGVGKCQMAGTTGGASGGTGGGGGCGGQGGKGGLAGGASIGIVSLGAKLTFSDVTIETKAGGKGGNGGLGQTGGPGGGGGMGGSKGNFTALNNGCAGGQGGKGGDGGRGGGGRGGHSIGVAHTGEAPATTGATITTGTPGNGGTGDGDTGTGAPGTAEKVQSFD